MPTRNKRKRSRVRLLPSTSKVKVTKTLVSGDGWSIYNIDSIAGCVLGITKPDVARVVYDFDCDLVDYMDAMGASPRTPVKVALGSLHRMMETFVDTERSGVLGEMAEHLRVIRERRRGLVAKYLDGKTPVPYGMLVEVLSTSIGQQIILTSRGVEIGCTVKSVHEHVGLGRWVEVEYQLWRADDRPGDMASDLVLGSDNAVIYAYDGERSLVDHGIYLSPSPEQRVRLVARARRCCELLRSCAHVKLTDVIQRKDYWGSWESTTAIGRGVVDPRGAKLDEPNANYYSPYADDGARAVDYDALTEAELFCFDPYVVAFSFAAKKYGRVLIDHVEAIRFRENAFDMLVLPPEDKNLMLSLVRNIDPTQTADFIDGKGGGCAMLFHGKPGLGKTLSAEAIAEVLQRPLYAVGIGELGVSPETLEKRLTKILHTAQRWNAVLLLDEADIFLEERSERDITRNAMVGVFLRLLEYYNGVLILTTNRVQHIDEAFFARVSLAIKFEEFTVEQRAQVIRNLLSLNGLSVPDDAIQSYAAKNVNGRQLKNSIRIARLVAHDAQRSMSIDDVEMITERMRKFREDVRRANAKADNGSAHRPKPAATHDA